MKSKSPAQSNHPVHSSSFETPKKKISSADGSKRFSDDGLHTPKIKRRSSTKKSTRKRRPSESDEEKIDKKTEENIQQVAMKNNLTEDAVKKILKKVVGNDHVLAIVKLKEEEMEKNNSLDKSSGVDTDDDDDHDIEHTPKITRSKAKVLNKKILPITAPTEPSEASILIQEELGSDDEDEEYEPGNEDAHSDDEHNSSVSDIDSQPRTPKTPYTADDDTPTKYTNDGLFKIPRDRNDSTTSLNEQDYIIAKRTRSKVSLTTTSIETIESTFQPPDISPDMYDRDNELDTDWLEFLNVLTKPINQTIEDDDETDPEYVVAADRIPIDKEELREVNISKKELSDLVDELFSNLSDVDFDEINKYDNIPELFRTKQKTNKNDSTHDMNRSDVQSDHENSFQPSQISTPVSSKPKANNLCNTSAGDDSVISILSNLTTNESNLLDSSNQTQTLVPVNVVNPFQGASLIDGVLQVPQYQQVLIQIPTIDILKIQAQEHLQQQQQQQSELISIRADQCGSEFNEDRLVSRASRYQYKLFQHLKTDLPVAMNFDKDLVGFTNHQRDILNQQLRMHVQFATQNFLQVYGNPSNNLWKEAPTLKSFLTELDDLANGSSIAIDNLRPSLDVIKKWEDGLMDPDTEDNKEYVEFLLTESTKSQDALQAKITYIPKFSPRMMNIVVDSIAFPYPHLLPKIPFRTDLPVKSIISEFVAVEDYLIAFFLEKYHKEYSDERIRNNSVSKAKISLKRICDRICSRMCPFRLSDSKNAVYRYVIRKKSKTEMLNPIQYYFKHNVAPPFNHKLIDYNNQRAPKDFSFDQLPRLWAEHTKNRLAREHSKNRDIQVSRFKPIQKVSPRVRCKISKKSNIDANSAETNFSSTLTSPKSQHKPTFIVRPRDISTDVSVPIQFEIVEVNSIAQFTELDLTGYTEVNLTNCIATSEDCKSDESHKHSEILEKEPDEKVTRCSEINRNESVEQCVCENNVKNLESENVNKPINKRPTKETCKTLNKHIPQKPDGTVLQKLRQIAYCLKRNYFHLHFKISNNNRLLAVHRSVRNFSIYMIFVEYNLKMANIIKRMGKDGGDELNRKSKLNEDIAEMQDSNNACSNIIVNVSTKKNPKTQRSDNTRLMLLPETKEEMNEKDLVYAQNFMDKVEEVYVAENKSEKVTEFLHILQTFNASTDKVEELYYKMEQLFLPEHPELAELFLTFLLPGHAAQIGKFMEHFMLTNMNNFISKLNTYFNKQPAQIRKIMTCLRDLSNEEDLKLEQVKTKIFPLLKGNPLLTEWFKQCFPNDTSYDDPGDEYESLSFHKAENAHQTDDENDVYENIGHSEITPDPVENPCHIRYLNGRVYYGSRVLLPAKLSFLVVTASDQNAINEVAKSDATHSKHSDNETDYRCAHSIKQYGDNKMKECQKNQLETPDNSVCEDADIEKSTDEQNCSDATDDAEAQASESCIQGASDSCIQGDDKNLSNSTESLENVYNICDDLTLKAHGIRLNPTVHQSNVIKSEDLLCLLDPIDDVADKLSEESLKNSPKKQTTRAQRKSPNCKKPTKRSPVNNKKAAQANIQVEDSNAIRTAKRLKRLIESDDMEEPDRLTKKLKVPKPTKVADVTKNRKNKLSTCDEPAAITNEKTESNTTCEPSTSATNVSTIWSRDEDKLVLEQIKMGFTNEENLVRILHRDKLPNRSYSEIYDRFKFLMDVIANL